MKKSIYGSALLVLAAGAAHAQAGAGWNDDDFIVTASNTASNMLLVYNTRGALIE